MANERGGKNILLKVNTTGSTYVTLGGLRSKGLTMNADGIDITNHGSNEWREFLDGAGIKNMSVSGSGVFQNDATLTTVRTNFLAQTLTNFQVVDDAASGITYQGAYKITSLEVTGEYNGEAVWSISLESSGEISIV